jgi:hypothetical protein
LQGFDWDKLAALDCLLRPFNLVQAISESASVTSGQIMAAWNWLYITIRDDAQNNLGLSAVDREILLKSISDRYDKYQEDHHLVCWLLDPRVYGAGLSKAGLRRVRFVALTVYKRIFPNYKEYDIDQLATQLCQYCEKQGGSLCCSFITKQVANSLLRTHYRLPFQ